MKKARMVGSGSEYPIGKILCVARNYLAHIKELGNETPERPVIFMKPSTSVIGDGELVVIPPYGNDCQHEVELAVLIGREGKDIPVAKVMDHVAGFGVALDLTLRDVQGELKGKGLPWEIAKGFDTACPLSPFVERDRVKNAHNLELTLSVNGEERQKGSSGLMMRSIPELVSYISGIFTLEPGDVILTGTPAGVGPLKSGDEVVAEISEVGKLTVRVQ